MAKKKAKKKKKKRKKKGKFADLDDDAVIALLTDYESCQDAKLELIARGSSVTPLLLERLEDREWPGREAAFEVFSEGNDPDAVDFLHKLLYVEDYEHGPVAVALAKIGADGTPHLLRILGFDDRLSLERRLVIAQALLHSRDDGSVRQFIGYASAGSQPLEIRLCFLDVIAKFKTREVVTALVRLLRDTQVHEKVCQVLEIIGTEVIKYLVADLKSTDPQVRSGAVFALAKTGKKKVCNPLFTLLGREKVLQIQVAAFTALAELGHKKAAPKIKGFLTHADARTRRSACEALGTLGRKADATAVAKLLMDDDSDVRAKSGEALGKIGGANALKALQKALDDQKSQAAAQSGLQTLYAGETSAARAKGRRRVEQIMDKAGLKFVKELEVMRPFLADPDEVTVEKARDVLRGLRQSITDYLGSE